MKVKKLMFSFLAICGMLTGCLSEPDFAPVLEDGIPINLDGSITQVATRVNAQGFEDKDALGLYAVNYENSNQTPGVLLDQGNQADHVKYIFDEASWKWTPVKPVYYKDVNTNVDLYAFYPHAEPSSVSAYNFEVQKDQSTAEKEGRLSGYEASDFLWGKAENVTPTESKIKIQLNHMMAGVQVVLKEGDGFDVAGDWDLLDKKVLVTNTTRKASIDLSTGIVTPIGGPQATGIVMCPQSDASFRAIVVPQTVEAQVSLFDITIGGVTYGFKKSSVYTYRPGKLHTFTITVNRKYPSGDYEFVLTDTQIADWKEDINTHEGEARQYYCVHCEEPGTLGRLIKADKKNPDKIRNLKVSGRITDSDAYFMRDSMDILEAINLKEAKFVDCVYWIAEGEHILMDDIIPYHAFRNKKTLYHFAFPESIKEISEAAFLDSSLSGALVLPDNVRRIHNYAFQSTNITSVTFPSTLERIDEWVFSYCTSLSGTLLLPESLTYIGWASFIDCSFTGNLVLPENLEYIGEAGFGNCGNFSGDLKIPDKITRLNGTFGGSTFNGRLDLNNVVYIGSSTFENCRFKGDLVLPEELTSIDNHAFYGNEFSTIKFPSTLKKIANCAFANNWRLTGDLILPEGLITIGDQAFYFCNTIESVEFPSTLQTIQDYAFAECHGISKIISRGIEPPAAQASAFYGVPKDNFVVEVPEKAVIQYKGDPVWGEFRKISAHYDFSISRNIARALNAEKSRKYILYAPANQSWTVESKPDWINVEPSSGVGKTEVTVTFNKMEKADAEHVRFDKYNNSGEFIGEDFLGRSGEIVFLLNDKDYTTSMSVLQYDYEYNDGDIIELNKATKGKGVNIVFMGDCYDAKDIASGVYLSDLQEGFEHFFAVEPYSTYKDYFNAYAIFGLSDDSGIGTVNTVKDSKFGSQYSLNGVVPDESACFDYALKAAPGADLTQTLIVMVENSTEYAGICYMWYDGKAIAICPKSREPYPYDFRGIIQHEAGGHGFGKLADEYIYHSAFISSCTCPCCEHVMELEDGKSIGWFRNLDVTGDINQVGWSHMIFHPQYSDVVDVFEGGYFHSRGVFRCESISCMNNNIPYYSAISRQAIVERIMDYAGEEFNLEKFYANDSGEFGLTTRSEILYSPTETYFSGKRYAPVIMGEKPNTIK
jgi:hypothetical protein